MRLRVPLSRPVTQLLIILLALVACSPTEPSPKDIPPESQLPLGSENPCWGGTYPDDIASLEDQGISASDLLVDTQTNDIYDSVCIEARISQYNEEWPPGMDERLVRATDL